jgi:hypothetical protein
MSRGSGCIRFVESVGFVLLLATCSARAISPQESKANSGPLTGSWECMAHGGSQGDTTFTLDLTQDGDNVSGSVSSPQGGMDITSATFKGEKLEIHLETPDGTYVLTAKWKNDKLLDGQTTLDGKPYGTWEGKKATQAEGKSGT